MTDVRVSIDLYANNKTGTTDPAIVSSSAGSAAQGTLTIRRSRIRVIFPVGFKLCSSSSVLQGGFNGITLTTYNLTGLVGVRRGLQYAARPAETAGESGRTEPNYGSTERIGTIRNAQESPVDPCKSATTCQDRIFEMTSTNEMIGFSSSTGRGWIERLEFTIANVINKVEPGQVSYYGVQAGDTNKEKSFFSVQLLDVFESATPSITQRYWNNRINDPSLNTTLAPWFACTNTRPVILGTNNFWGQAVQLEPSRTNADTTATVTMETYSEWPVGGYVKITFPQEFTVPTSGIIGTMTASSMITVGTFEPIIVDGNERSVFLQRRRVTGSCDRSNPALANFCSVPKNSILTLKIAGIRTPNATGGLELTGGILTDRFRVEMGAGSNATLDAGFAGGVVLGASDLTKSFVSIALNEYTVGTLNTKLIFSFKPQNSLGAGGTIELRMPTNDLTINLALYEVTSSTLFFEFSSPSTSGSFTVITLRLSSGYAAESIHSITVSGLRNRAYSGPASANFGIQIFKANKFLLDFADKSLDQGFSASSFMRAAVTFPKLVASSGNITVQFTITNELPADGRIFLQVPGAINLAAMTGVFAGPGKMEGEQLTATIVEAGSFKEITILRSGTGVRMASGDSASFAIPGAATPAYVIDLNFTLSTQVCIFSIFTHANSYATLHT
jgi:hypothetical protein